MQLLAPSPPQGTSRYGGGRVVRAGVDLTLVGLGRRRPAPRATSGVGLGEATQRGGQDCQRSANHTRSVSDPNAWAARPAPAAVSSVASRISTSPLAGMTLGELLPELGEEAAHGARPALASSHSPVIVANIVAQPERFATTR